MQDPNSSPSFRSSIVRLTPSSRGIRRDTWPESTAKRKRAGSPRRNTISPFLNVTSFAASLTTSICLGRRNLKTSWLDSALACMGLLPSSRVAPRVQTVLIASCIAVSRPEIRGSGGQRQQPCSSRSLVSSTLASHNHVDPSAATTTFIGRAALRRSLSTWSVSGFFISIVAPLHC